MHPVMMIASFIVSAAAIPCCLVLLQVILLLVAQPALWSLLTGSAAAGGVVAVTVAGVLIFTIIRSGLQVGVLPGKAWKVYALLIMMLLISVWMLVLINFSPDKTLTRSSMMLGSLACTYTIMMMISDWVNRNQQVKFGQGVPDGAQYVFARI